MKLFFILTLLGSQLFSNNFIIRNQDAEITSIDFRINEFSFNQVDGYDHLISDSKGSILDYGHPELPTYSFNYAVENNKEYDIEYTIKEFEIYENINLYPTQPLTEKSISFVKDQEFYSSFNNYPDQNILFNRQSIRQYEMLAVTFIPFEYNFSTKQLKVFTEVDLKIIEKESFRQNRSMPRSEVFEKMYKSKVINDFNLNDLGIDLQQPSILYICGGNSATSDYYLLEPLIEWRRQQGYEVNVVSLNQTGSSTSSIKNYISSALSWENPPEYICFVGDAYGNYEVETYWVSIGGGGGWSQAEGEGDHAYSLLTGDDLLADVLLGRMSIRTQSDLSTVVNKIIGYEKNINPLTNISNGTDWQNAAALVGDQNPSGISTVITNEYINSVFDIHGGIDDVRTLYGESTNNWDNWMRDQFDDGVGYFNYRGIAGFSGFSENDINDLENGYKLPFVTTLTCDTGSFYSQNACTTEALFRAGTAANPRGAVAAIGIAQNFTHTLFNNIVDMGIYESLFIGDAKTAGESLAYGKLALNDVYPENPNDNVYLFSVWNNLIGDPATHLWKSSPGQLFVSHNNILIKGSNNFQVLVEDLWGNSVEDAIVTLYAENDGIIDLQLTSKTDANGIADFILGNNDFGNAIVTTRGQDYIPIQTNVEFSEDLPEIVLNQNSISIDDSFGQTTNGNDDGVLNPSEIVNLSFSISNNSEEQVDNLYVSLSSLSEYITILGDNYAIDSLTGNSSESIFGFILQINEYIPDDDDNKIRISITSDNLEWNYELPLEIYSGNLIFNDTIITNDNNNNGRLDRGESAELRISLSNVGSLDLIDVTGNIDNSELAINISESNFIFSSIGAGSSSNSTNQINISIDNQFPEGTIINIPITISSSNGFSSNVIVPLQVGEISENDPLGPDLYGYYIYDQNDDYLLSPDYEWIEIDPTQGGNGDELEGIYDPGDNNDDVVTIDLPFTFRFYGVEYNDISISSNGWIAFGETEMKSFRNYPMPGPGGPPQMVAVFWDDLKAGSSTTGGVYTHHNTSEDIFIIEWSNVRTYFDNSIESFQIILYNTSFEQTVTGDGEMKLQYKEFNNTSYGFYPVGNWEGTPLHGQYCTVGIENHLGNDGLEYTYNNTYPDAAMPLQDQTAILITTGPSFISDIMFGDMNVDGIINILDVISVVNLVLDTNYDYVADMNSDGIVNVLDIIQVINIILNS